MLKNIKKFKIKEKKSDYNFRIFYYAQAAKKERLLNNWTLQYVSHGLCSISYMSKFENHLITPEVGFLKELGIVYGVKFDNDQLEITQEMLDKVLNVYIQNDFESISEMYQQLKDNRFNVPRALILSFYYLLTEDESNLIKQINELDLIKDSMTNQEQILFLFIVMQYKLNSHDYSEMVYYLSCFDGIDLQTSDEKWMLAYIEMTYGYHMDDMSIILKNRKTLFEDCNLCYPTSGKIMANLIFLEVVSRKSYNSVIKEVESIYTGVFSEKIATDIFYQRCLIMLNGNKFQEIFDEIVEKNLKDVSRFLALLGYCTYKMPTESNVQSFDKYAKDFIYEKQDRIHKTFIEFIGMLIKDPNNKNLEVRELAKFTIIPYNKTHRHVLYSKVYYDYFVTILRSDSKYKDTVNFIIDY